MLETVIRQRKRNKWDLLGRKEVKLSIFANDMMYIENIKMLPRTIKTNK